MKSQIEADALLRATPLPPNWRLESRVLRRYRWRSLYQLVLYRGEMVEGNWSHVDLERLVRMAVAHAEREAAA